MYLDGTSYQLAVCTSTVSIVTGVRSLSVVSTAACETIRTVHVVGIDLGRNVDLDYVSDVRKAL